MIRPLFLEDFTDPIAGEPRIQTQPVTLDTDASLAAYENGYRNGWDDCARAAADEQRQIGTDLAASLNDLTQSHANARRDVLASLGPLFDDIATQLLPRLAAEAVAPVLIAELRSVAQAASDARIIMMAAPAAVPALERLITDYIALPIDLRAEPAFADGQISIRFGTEQRDINLSEAASQMAEAIRGFIAQEIASAPHLPSRKGTD